MCPFRPNPLAPFPAREGGNFSPPRFGEGPRERLTCHEWDPKLWEWEVQGGASHLAEGVGVSTFTPTEISLRRPRLKRGWRGRSPLPRGLGDVPPKISKKGRAANSYHPATSGTQNPGKS
jgi:hypothetical protein